jgi:hypothetical protein
MRHDRIVICLLLASVSTLPAAADAEVKSMVVDDPRPVARAVERLEALYGFPVTYEDPPYVHESELADVTDQVRGDKQKLNRVVIPKGGPLAWAYEMASTDAYPGGGLRQSAGAAADAVASMLQSHATSRGTEMFTTLSDGLLHVVPTHFIDPSGKAEPLTPLLSTKIDVSPQRRTGAGLVSEVCQSLSRASGQAVAMGTIPLPLLATHVTTLEAFNETARSVLSRLLREIRLPLSWQLFYDPGSRGYVLNIHAVTPVNQ